MTHVAPPPAPPPVTQHSKALLHQQARAALVGVTVHALHGDDGRPEYIATRWAMTKAHGSLEELSAWLDRVGAPA